MEEIIQNKEASKNRNEDNLHEGQVCYTIFSEKENAWYMICNFVVKNGKRVSSPSGKNIRYRIFRYNKKAAVTA